jgi:molybdopterin-guanine dinucleotide biosynthesis protein A
MASTVKKPRVPAVSICILAGGLSSRMGRDKSRIRIGRRTMLGHIRALAAQLGLPVRVLRRDAVPRCGPIGGIYTALTRTRADAILFLACDMPFVTLAFLKEILRAFSKIAHVHPRRPDKSLRRTSSHPLPKGEGWGEGEGNVKQPTIFSSHKKLLGLPCIIARDSLPIIARQIARFRFSLHSLARALKAKSVTPLRNPDQQLLNLNTPEDLASARRCAGSATFAMATVRK